MFPKYVKGKICRTYTRLTRLDTEAKQYDFLHFWLPRMYCGIIRKNQKMTIKKDELIRKYVKAIQEGNAAIFAGAGLSRPSGFVDWKGLLRPLAADIDLDVDKEKDLLSVAQFYRNKKGYHTPISQAIVDAFSKDVNTNDNVRIVTRLPIFTYWTTNYDKLIEKGLEEANRNPDVKSEQDQLSVMKHDRDAVVYKMHGDVTRPKTAVLTKSDYELYENNRPLFRTALKGDLLSKVFLFIGFSFEDPNLDYILGQIRSLLGEEVPEHFCFFRRVQKSDYKDDKEYGYDKARQEMQIDNLKYYGIQTVLVDSYREITEILQEIEKASKLKNIFISGSIEKYVAPWNKDKAEELAGKLSEALVHEGYRVYSGFGLGIGSAVVNGALNVIYSEKYRHVDKHLCLRPFPQNISDPVVRADRWKKYREGIFEETGISIFIFGNKEDKTSGSILEADGCIQEFEIASKKGNAIIPVGSTGYAAKTILEKVKADIVNYPYLVPYISQLETEIDVDNLVKLVTGIVEKMQ